MRHQGIGKGGIVRLYIGQVVVRGDMEYIHSKNQSSLKREMFFFSLFASELLVNYFLTGSQESYSLSSGCLTRDPATIGVCRSAQHL